MLISSIIVSAVANTQAHASLKENDISTEHTLPVILSELADKSWIAFDRAPFQYVEYSWHTFGKRMTYNGLDNDGNVVAGDFTLDPKTGQYFSFHVRKGIVTEFVMDESENQIELVGEELGVPVAQIIQRQRSGLFKVVFLELRHGVWTNVREAKLFHASPQQVRALGWIEKNPEFEKEAEIARQEALAANPSFGKRLINALGDGVVAGVRQGVESRVTREIER